MAFNAYLKLDGITGESQGGLIRLENFSWGVSNSNSIGSGTGGAGAGKASFQDFSFAAAAGKQSPQLFQAAVEGRLIGTGTLTVNDKVDLLTIKFSDVFISSYKLDEGGIPAVQRDLPVENVSFNFAKIEFQVGGNTALG